MKKILFLATLAIFSVTAVNAQKSKAKKATKAVAAKVETTPKAATIDGAGMLFDSETIDYGTIPADSDGNRKFEFVNNGNKPLIISNTQ